MVEANFSFQRKHLLHFVPTMIFLLHAVLVYGIVVFENNFQQKDAIAASLFYNHVKHAEDLMAILSGIIYWWFSYTIVLKYRKWLFASQSNTEYTELTWLKNILLLTGILVVLLFVSVVLEYFSSYRQYPFPHLQIFYAFLSVFIYYLSFQGLRKYVLSKPGGLSTARNSMVTAGEEPNNEHEQGVILVDGLTEIRQETVETPVDHLPVSSIKEKIVNLLETEKLFLNPELSLKDFAKAVGYPSAIVSTTINQHFKMNFRNLINLYRVDEVKKRLAADDDRHLSLLGIAFACGFNSEASFFRIFRNLTGMSPKDYSNAQKQ